MNFRTNIQLIDEYQLVLASQQSGTFFCIYAKFEKNDKFGEENEKEYKVYFDVKNYRGNARIKIKKVTLGKQIPNILRHIIIHTEVGSHKVEKHPLLEINIQKGEFFVCERESVNTNTATQDFIPSEEEYINLGKGYTTQYKAEKNLVSRFMSEIEDIASDANLIEGKLELAAKNKIVTILSAHEVVCVIGNSKVI